MSGQVVGWAMKQRTGSAAAKLILAKMADNSGDDGLAWPSIATIIDHTELGQSTVYRHIATLEALGLVRPTKIAVHPGEPDEYVCDGWQLNVPPEWRIPAAGIRPARGKKIPAARKAIPVAGTAYKEEPSLEPSLNLGPDAARALEGRVAGPGCERVGGGHMAKVAKWFEPGAFDVWFKDAYFREGPPLTLVLATRAKCSWVQDRFRDRLSKALKDELAGSDLVFAFERERETTDA